MRCIELFAGAGGAAVGLERAGIEHAALVEWDRDACATMRAAGLGPVVEGDVRDHEAIAAAAGDGPVDLLWSSFPCQAWSTAGRREGAADERNGWPWTTAAIDRFAPTWFLGENVRGLLLHRGGCGFREGQCGLFGGPPVMSCAGCYFESVILPDLRARFACVGWWLLDAADFGVPQHRKRVILWAGPAPIIEPVPTHGPRAGAPWMASGCALEIAPTEVVACFSPRPEGAARVKDRKVINLTNRPCGTLTSKYSGGLGGQPWVGIGEALGLVAQPGGEPHLLRPSPTVSAIGERAGSGKGGKAEKRQRASDALYLGTGRRALTIAECATLQAFPAGWPWQGNKAEQYRQVGNAVAPPMAEVVARALIVADRKRSVAN